METAHVVFERNLKTEEVQYAHFQHGGDMVSSAVSYVYHIYGRSL